MTDAAPELVEKVPALGISMSINISQHHAITLQSFVDRDDGDAKALIDNMAKQADRLIARYRLKDLRKNLALNETQLKHLVEDLGRIDAAHLNQFEVGGKRGPFQRNAKQEGERNNALVTRKRFEELIAQLKADIAEVEKEAE